MSSTFYPSVYILINGVKTMETFSISEHTDKVVTYSHNGTIIQELFKYNDKNHGTFKKFYNDGSIMEFLNYKYGKLHGLCETYYSNGKIKESRNYKFDRICGKSSEFFEDGGIKQISFYRNGKKHGLQKIYHPNGVLHKKQYFSRNRLHGNVQEFHDTGKLKLRRSYFYGKKTGVFHQYYPTGELEIKLRFNRNGHKYGPANIYHKNGSIKEYNFYRNNLREGNRFQYYENGKTKTVCFYREGEKNGVLQCFDETDRLVCSKTYINHIKQGLFQDFIYGEDGFITKTEGYYRNNRKDGLCVETLNDTVRKVCRYSHGVLHGIQNFYINDISQVFYYHYGRCVSEKKSTIEECCVCYEQTNYETTCSHRLCIECSEKTNSKCPMCRQIFQ